MKLSVQDIIEKFEKIEDKSITIRVNIASGNEVVPGLIEQMSVKEMNGNKELILKVSPDYDKILEV